MLADLPSVWFVLWANAVLSGRVSLDEGAEGIAGPQVTHRVEGLPEDPGPVTVAVALGRLRTAGVSRVSLALPIPGDPLGLGGPVAFTTAAVEVGEAVLVPERGLGLLPEPHREAAAATLVGVRWHTSAPVVAAEPDDSLGPAETAVRLALIAAADELTDLDVAAGGVRPRPPGGQRRHLPPGTDGRAAHLLQTADRMLDTVAAALANDGGALTAGQAAHRRAVLQPLEHAARRAVLAACAQQPGWRRSDQVSSDRSRSARTHR